MATPYLPPLKDHSGECVSGVYVIRHRDSGMMYVGSTFDVHKRWKQRYVGKMAIAFSEHGKDAFEYALVLPCIPDKNILAEMETWLISELSPEYNSVSRAYPSVLGIKRSDDTRSKMGAWQVGRVIPQETKDKISIAMKGRPGHPQTAEAREKVAAAKRGKKRPPEVMARVVATKRAKMEAALAAAMGMEANNG